MRSIRFVLAGYAALLSCVTLNAATVTSPRVDVALQALILNSITLTVVAPAVAFGVVTPGVTNAAPLAQAVSIVTAWNLGAGVSLKLYAYFDSSTDALTGTTTGSLIPTSAMTGTVNGGSPQGFTATSPFTAGATAMQLYTQAVTSSNLVSTRTDALALTMNLTGLNPQADSYVGVMHLQAQAL